MHYSWALISITFPLGSLEEMASRRYLQSPGKRVDHVVLLQVVEDKDLSSMFWLRRPLFLHWCF